MSEPPSQPSRPASRGERSDSPGHRSGAPPPPGRDPSSTASPASLVEWLPDAALALDRDFRILTVNELAVRMFGHSPDALLGERIGVLLPERSRGDLLERIRDHLTRSESARESRGRLDFPGRRRDGEEFPAEASVVGLPGGAGRLLVVVRDVSRRHQRGRQLRQAQAIARLGSWEWSVGSDRVE